jgi:hypothetical protein
MGLTFSFETDVLFVTEIQILFYSESPARHGISHLHSTRVFYIFKKTKFTHIYEYL